MSLPCSPNRGLSIDPFVAVQLVYDVPIRSERTVDLDQLRDALRAG